MGMRALESAILAELRKVENNPKIKNKDIMEWTTSDKLKDGIKEGEKEVHLTIFENQSITVAYKLKQAGDSK